MTWYSIANQQNEDLSASETSRGIAVSQCANCRKFKTIFPDPRHKEFDIHKDVQEFSEKELQNIKSALNGKRVSHGLCYDCWKELYGDIFSN